MVAVVGTGTDVGKTWVSAQVLRALRSERVSVAARKPAQSFEPSDDPAGYDATVLGAASGEIPETVCPPHRWYEVAMAPPMAAEALERPSFGVADLLAELQWPADAVEVGFVETAGGLRSPIARDGDCLAFVRAVRPDCVVLVADAGLGTINSVRLTMDALGDFAGSVVIVLNRFDDESPLHRRNLAWLDQRDGLRIAVTPGGEAQLAELVRTGS
ncbi:MAG TPA: dethiobiotin synthase [Acidimicrobiales bacterium]|jgi:dethiobiotin synthetase|nr:dethiobiotin synthase [Acidimicrobiales bacterium]